MNTTVTIYGHTLRFDHPEFIGLWVIVAVVAFIFFVRLLGFVGMQLLRREYSAWETLKRTTRGVGMLGFSFSTAFWCLVGLLLTFALAEPYEENAAVRVPVGSIHAVFAFDESPSEGAEYYRGVMPTPPLPDGTHPAPLGPWGNNDQVARWIATERIMPAMPGNKIGLVAFTGESRVVSQLREDYSTLRYELRQSDWLTAPGGGSDPAEGLRASIQALRKAIGSREDLQKQQLIFMFTDGGISDIEPQQNGKIDEEAKSVWERDFGRCLQELGALAAAVKEADGKPPQVVLVGLGGDNETMIPLYWDTGERIRDENGEPDWFPYGEPKDKKLTTRYSAENMKMLQERIGAVVPCKVLRMPLDWGQIEKTEWVKDVLGGTKASFGKRYWAELPLNCAMVLMALLFMRVITRPSDQLARTSALADE